MDPGTALATVSLSFQLFAGCVQGFVLLNDARYLAKDASVERTKLMIQEFRLIEWARAAKLGTPEQDVSPAGFNKQLAALILVQLEQLLSSTDTLRRRYKLELVPVPDNSIDMTNKDSSSSPPVRDFVSRETRTAILDQVGRVDVANKLPKRLRWAAVDKNKYAQLVADVTGLIDSLWSLLDIPQRIQTSRAVVQMLQLAIQTSQEIGGLRDLQLSLQASQTDTDMMNGLAASAGLKASHVSLSEAHPDDNAEVQPPKLLKIPLNPFQLTGIRMISSTVGLSSYQGKAVVIEEKRVQPKMKGKLRSRVESLVQLLYQPPTTAFRTLACLGYTEEQAGFRMVFSIPVDDSKAVEQPLTLLSVLSKSNGRLPNVGTRLRLAVQICHTLLSFHTAGWLHKDMRSENILLMPQNPDQDNEGLGQPYLCGFSFSREDSPSEISEQPSADIQRDIYRHAQALGEPSESFERYMDAYSLGCVLVEIAEWAPLRKIIKKRVDTSAQTGVKLSDVACLSTWLHERYIKERVAAFRLGAAFAEMLALCIPAAGEKPDLTRFYYALEGMSSCTI